MDKLVKIVFIIVSVLLIITLSMDILEIFHTFPVQK